MKSILLIGLGRFGRHIAQELNELGHQVMAIDSNEDRVNAVLSYVTNAQIGDSTSEYFLRSLGVGNFDVCIVTIGGNFQSSLETTSLLKELGAKLVVSSGLSGKAAGKVGSDPIQLRTHSGLYRAAGRPRHHGSDHSAGMDGSYDR